MKCLLVIIAIVLLIVSIVGLIYKKINTPLGDISLVFCLISIVALFLMLILCLDKTSDVPYFIKKYNQTNYLIETYTISKDNNLVQLTELLENVEYINRKIISNRNNKDNVFIGCFYSEEIAELEFINTENLNLN